MSVPGCMPMCVCVCVCTCMCVLLEGLSAPHAQVLVLLKIRNPLPNTSPTLWEVNVFIIIRVHMYTNLCGSDGLLQ